MIKAFVTNLGLYNQGELCGEWLSLPATKGDVEGLLARIGVDGVIYEGTFISDYEISIEGLSKHLGEYESIDELNYLAALISDMDDWEMERFKAAVVCGEYCGSVHELINLTHNLDCYELYPGVRDDEDLGRYLIEEMGFEEVPERLQNYIDYEAYGRDFHISEGGEFIDNGYVYRNNDRFNEYYNGRDDLPDEYKIFCYPDKKSVKQQLEVYGKMARLQTDAGKSEPIQAER